MLLDLVELIIAFFQYLYLILTAPQVTYPKAWNDAGVGLSVLALGKDLLGKSLDFFVSDYKVFFTVIAVVLPLLLIFLGLIALNPKRNVIWFFALLVGLLFLMAGIAASIMSSYLGNNFSEQEATNMIIIGCLILVVCAVTLIIQKLTKCCEEENEDDQQLINGEDAMARDTEEINWTEQAEGASVFIILFVLGLIFIAVIPPDQIGLDRIGLGSDAMLKVLLPIGIIFLIFSCVSAVWTGLTWFKKGRQWRWKAVAAVETNAMWALLVIMSLLYMPITSAVFVMFNCNPLTCEAGTRIIDEGSVLVPYSTDSREGCTGCHVASGQVCPANLLASICSGATDSRLEASVDVPCERMQAYFFPAAGILIAAFIVGLPLLFFQIIRQSATMVLEVVPAAPGATEAEKWESKLSITKNVAKFLYQPTEYKYRFLRLYEIARRFITTIVSTYIFRTSFSSGFITVYVSLAVHTATLILFIVLRPHIDVHENRTVMICCATLVGFLIFATVAVHDSDLLPSGLLITVLTLAVVIPVCCLGYGLWLWWQKHQSATAEQQLLDDKQLKHLIYMVEEETLILELEELQYVEEEENRIRARAEERRNRKLFNLDQYNNNNLNNGETPFPGDDQAMGGDYEVVQGGEGVEGEDALNLTRAARRGVMLDVEDFRDSSDSEWSGIEEEMAGLGRSTRPSISMNLVDTNKDGDANDEAPEKLDETTTNTNRNVMPAAGEYTGGAEVELAEKPVPETVVDDHVLALQNQQRPRSADNKSPVEIPDGVRHVRQDPYDTPAITGTTLTRKLLALTTMLTPNRRKKSKDKKNNKAAVSGEATPDVGVTFTQRERSRSIAAEEMLSAIGGGANLINDNPHYKIPPIPDTPMVKTTMPIVISINQKAVNALGGTIPMTSLTQHDAMGQSGRRKGKIEYERHRRRRAFKSAIIENIRNENNGIDHRVPVVNYVDEQKRHRVEEPKVVANPFTKKANRRKSAAARKSIIEKPKIILPASEVEQCLLILEGATTIEEVAEHRFTFGKEMQVAVAKGADMKINKKVQRTFNLWLMIAGFLAFVALGFSFMGLLDTPDVVTIPPVYGGTSTVDNEFAGYGSWENFTRSCCCIPYGLPIHSRASPAEMLWLEVAGGNVSLANSKSDRPRGTEGAKERYTNGIAKVEKWVCANGRVKERARAARSGEYGDQPNTHSFVGDSSAAIASYTYTDTTDTIRAMCGVTFDDPTCAIDVDYTGQITFSCGSITSSNDYKSLW